MLCLVFLAGPVGAASDDLDKVVREFLKPEGYIDGIDIKAVRRSGDAAIIAALRSFDTTRAPDEKTAASLVYLVEVAFRDIGQIEDRDSRIPAVSQLLLRSLAAEHYGEDLHGRIIRAAQHLARVRSHASSPGPFH